MVSWKTKLKLAWWTRGNWSNLFKCYKCFKSCKKSCCVCCDDGSDASSTHTTDDNSSQASKSRSDSTISPYGATNLPNEDITIDRKSSKGKAKKPSKQSPLLGSK